MSFEKGMNVKPRPRLVRAPLKCFVVGKRVLGCHLVDAFVYASTSFATADFSPGFWFGKVVLVKRLFLSFSAMDVASCFIWCRLSA
ncbi:MAG: hypothetical protein QXW17_04590 [Candidatus Bathyarchaeia archaeon]